MLGVSLFIMQTSDSTGNKESLSLVRPLEVVRPVFHQSLLIFYFREVNTLIVNEISSTRALSHL